MTPTILLFRGRGLMSSLIRWQTRSHYAHAAIYNGNNYIIEAWPGAGVRMKKITDFRDVDFFYYPGISAECTRAMQNFAASQIGKPYDYLGCARFVTRSKDQDRTPDRWFCSELVFAAFKHAGMSLLNIEQEEAWKVSPGMLATSPVLVKRTAPKR